MRRPPVIAIAAIAVATGALAGCGAGVKAGMKGSSTTTTSHTAAPSWVAGPYTSPVPASLPFDVEENTFIGTPDAQHHGLGRTGCYAVVATFDSKSVEVCDCAYRQLRSEGYPASQLAAIATSIAANSKTNQGPEWFNVPITKCWADLDGG
jgi:hypothetical protein